MNWLASMRSRIALVIVLPVCLISPTAAWAGKWGENWGEMIFESFTKPIPTLSALGLAALGIFLTIAGVRMVARRRRQATP